MSRLEELTAAQAQYVLGRVVADKKIRSRDIDKYLREMDREIESLEQKLTTLREIRTGSDDSTPARKSRSRKRKRGARAKGSAKRAGKGTARKAKKAAKKAKKKSRKATTPEAMKSRQLQGLYISLVKRFTGRDRDKYKKIAKEKGREEAVKQMKAALGN